MMLLVFLNEFNYFYLLL